jgi:DNA-binding NarL/FixJ family response regulator
VTVLAFIVEDHDLVRDALRDALAEMSALEVVGSAASAAEAVAWLRRNPDGWHIVVIDLLLVHDSGLEVLKACRSRRSTQRAVVLTGYGTSEMRRMCAALGADAVFDKSTEIDELIAYCVEFSRSITA